MRFFLTTFVLAALAGASVPSMADVYLGLDTRIDEIAWHDPAAANYPQDTMGAAFHIGDRFSPYFGTEFGYSDSYGELNYTPTNTTTQSVPIAEAISDRLTIREFQLDNFAHLPLGPEGWVQPFVTLGAAYSDANARVRITTESSDSSGNETKSYAVTPFFHKQELDWRVGFGVQFQPLDAISLRFLVRYQPYSFKSEMSGGATLGLGLNAAL